MEMLTLIISLSFIMWYLIDKAKGLWSEVSWGKYLTIAISAIAAFALTFSFNLDLICALGLTKSMTMAGQILTGFTLMSGSSAVAEVIEKIKGGKAA